MAEITPAQVHDLLTSTHEFLTSAQAATQARDHLGHLLLDVARQAKAGLRDLSAVSGLHHATIRAMIQRALGPGLPDGWDQPELPILAELGQPSSEPKPSAHVPTMPLPPASSVAKQVMVL
ncbi:MAG: hypothetical protein LBI33_07080 [Propionibacteriaceae bacterium]|jgi:hypothetical protein|nr:hypothetical protein [Propionibacteriaceae bacterium]